MDARRRSSLPKIEVRAEALLMDQQRVWNELSDLLRAAGIELCDTADLEGEDISWLNAWFMERLFPVLTPLAVDPAHPFPFIPNMGLVMVLRLMRADDATAVRALIPLPSQVERFIRLPAALSQSPYGSCGWKTWSNAFWGMSSPACTSADTACSA